MLFLALLFDESTLLLLSGTAKPPKVFLPALPFCLAGVVLLVPCVSEVALKALRAKSFLLSTLFSIFSLISWILSSSETLLIFERLELLRKLLDGVSVLSCLLSDTSSVSVPESWLSIETTDRLVLRRLEGLPLSSSEDSVLSLSIVSSTDRLRLRLAFLEDCDFNSATFGLLSLSLSEFVSVSLTVGNTDLLAFLLDRDGVDLVTCSLSLKLSPVLPTDLLLRTGVGGFETCSDCKVWTGFKTINSILLSLASATDLLFLDGVCFDTGSDCSILLSLASATDLLFLEGVCFDTGSLSLSAVRLIDRRELLLGLTGDLSSSCSDGACTLWASTSVASVREETLWKVLIKQCLVSHFQDRVCWQDN